MRKADKIALGVVIAIGWIATAVGVGLRTEARCELRLLAQQVKAHTEIVQTYRDFRLGTHEFPRVNVLGENAVSEPSTAYYVGPQYRPR